MSSEREPIRRVVGTAAPLPIDNVDTDQIIPARYLKITDKSGLAEGLFFNWRFLAEDTARPDPEFVLNRPERRGATILVAGDNFGCGSSREHAPWALLAYGFRAVISTRFADIFRNNALKNGLVVVEAPAAAHARLLERITEDPSIEVTVDLEHTTVSAPGTAEFSFTIDAFSRYCLLNGIDQFGYLLQRLPQIDEWERSQSAPVDTTAG